MINSKCPYLSLGPTPFLGQLLSKEFSGKTYEQTKGLSPVHSGNLNLAIIWALLARARERKWILRIYLHGNFIQLEELVIFSENKSSF